MTRAYNTATTQQNSGGAVNPFAAGKNKIINGDFGVWQRGTSFTSPSTVYTADRFQANGITGDVVSQQTFTRGNAIAGYESQYFLRYASSATAGTRYFFQKVEDVRTLAGQTVTFSFWAKVNSGTASVTTYFYQQFGSGGSADVQSSSGTYTVTTSWQRFTFTITMPSVSGKTIGAGSLVQAAFLFSDVSKNLDIWGYQLEAGSVATPFQTATGTIQGELAACQRYYQRTTVQDVNGRMSLPTPAITASACYIIIQHAVQMRAKVTSIDYSSVIVGGDLSGTITPDYLALNAGGVNFTTIQAQATSLFTQYRPYFLLANNTTSAYIGYSAEL